MRKSVINGILAVIFAAVIVICLLAMNNGENGAVAEITINGETVQRINLSDEGIYKISEHNTVKVENRGIQMIYADCPDKVCVNTGVIYNSSYPIVCLPNKMVVRIDGKSNVDAISGK